MEEVEAFMPAGEVGVERPGVEATGLPETGPVVDEGGAVDAVQDGEEQPVDRRGDQGRLPTEFAQGMGAQEDVAQAEGDSVTLGIDTGNPRNVDQIVGDGHRDPFIS